LARCSVCVRRAFVCAVPAEEKLYRDVCVRYRVMADVTLWRRCSMATVRSRGARSSRATSVGDAPIVAAYRLACRLRALSSLPGRPAQLAWRKITPYRIDGEARLLPLRGSFAVSWSGSFQHD